MPTSTLIITCDSSGLEYPLGFELSFPQRLVSVAGTEGPRKC